MTPGGAQRPRPTEEEQDARRRAVHETATSVPKPLRAGVIILEALDLSEVEPGDYELTCFPLRISGVDGALARVVLRKRRRGGSESPRENDTMKSLCALV